MTVLFFSFAASALFATHRPGRDRLFIFPSAGILAGVSEALPDLPIIGPVRLGRERAFSPAATTVTR